MTKRQPSPISFLFVDKTECSKYFYILGEIPPLFEEMLLQETKLKHSSQVVLRWHFWPFLENVGMMADNQICSKKKRTMFLNCAIHRVATRFCSPSISNSRLLNKFFFFSSKCVNTFEVAITTTCSLGPLNYGAIYFSQGFIKLRFFWLRVSCCKPKFHQYPDAGIHRLIKYHFWTRGD